jgi:hypothetical protein
MKRWRFVAHCSWISKMDKLNWSPEELNMLEEEIARVYTQSFHNCFRRAPIVPHRLSENAVELSPLVGRVYYPVLAPRLENNPTFIVNKEATL